MTKKTRYFLFGSVTVLLVVLQGWWPTTPACRWVPSAAPGVQPSSAVPADATLVAYADVRT
jgi:hypothetical protein